MVKPALFLYIHIPFCLQKCKYCDFATTPWTSDDQARQYMGWIEKELLLRGKSLKNHQIQSIYFGGGTPSLIPPDSFKKIISLIENYFPHCPSKEVTVEVNPGTLSSEKIERYLNAGINRFSIGVQTFSNSSLKLCGREHTAEDTRETLRLLNEKNLNFSCDLLFALPHQSLPDVQKDLYEILSFSPSHISTYCLTLPSGHLLQSHRPSDQNQIEMFEWIEQTLKKNQYFQYEISNFSKKNQHSRHNMAYWTDQEFWGLGISSHSYLKHNNYGVRFWNPKNIKNYLQQLELPSSPHPYSSLPPSQVEVLTYKKALTDHCLVSLRMNKGIRKEALQKKFGTKVLSQIHNKISRFEEDQLIIQSPEAWKLNFKGRMLSNMIFAELIF